MEYLPGCVWFLFYTSLWYESSYTEEIYRCKSNPVISCSGKDDLLIVKPDTFLFVRDREKGCEPSYGSCRVTRFGRCQFMQYLNDRTIYFNFHRMRMKNYTGENMLGMACAIAADQLNGVHLSHICINKNEIVNVLENNSTSVTDTLYMGTDHGRFVSVPTSKLCRVSTSSANLTLRILRSTFVGIHVKIKAEDANCSILPNGRLIRYSTLRYMNIHNWTIELIKEQSTRHDLQLILMMKANQANDTFDVTCEDLESKRPVSRDPITCIDVIEPPDQEPLIVTQTPDTGTFWEKNAAVLIGSGCAVVLVLILAITYAVRRKSRYKFQSLKKPTDAAPNQESDMASSSYTVPNSVSTEVRNDKTITRRNFLQHQSSSASGFSHGYSHAFDHIKRFSRRLLPKVPPRPKRSNHSIGSSAEVDGSYLSF